MKSLINASKSEIMQEFYKCKKNPTYYAENYCEVFDNTQKGFSPFILFPRQQELMDNLMENDFNLVTKPRQAGVSTVAGLYAACQMIFCESKFPQKILIIANRQDIAQLFLEKIKGPLSYLPKAFGIHVVSESKGTITLSNGSQAKAVATSENALRGFTPTQLIMDEAAFIEGGDGVWRAAAPALSTGGKAIFISTPNGKDPLYYETYAQAKSGEGEFKVTELRWHEDPRFNVDLEWLKEDCPTIVEMDILKHKDLLAEGYKPTSSWYRKMCSKFNHDKITIAQELDCNFVGSGDNVIDEEYISFQENTNVREPHSKIGPDKGLWIWKDVNPDHDYIISSDVGSGSASDFSSFIVHDITTNEEVAEFHGRIKADVLGELINEWGYVYNTAYVIIDITGGYGNPTLLTLNNMGYPNIHFSTQTDETFEKSRRIDPNAQKSKPGFWFTNQNRRSVTLEFEKTIRGGEIKIRSQRLINEMRTYIYKNGRADHMAGKHDDIIMAYAMCMYILERSFKEIERAKEQKIVMLNAVKTSADFDNEITPAYHHSNDAYNQSITPELTKKYSWLFG